MTNAQQALQALKTKLEQVVDIWSAEDIEGSCPFCEAHAIVELTERLKKIQPDGTTHVCHPGFGGCNQGFAVDCGRAA